MRARPALMDRLKPWLRAIGYATPLQRELRRLLRGRAGLRAIQVGAHDGVTHDPFREHLILPGRQAVVLEPNPEVFATLVRNYHAHPQVTPVNAAVAYTVTRLRLWTLDPAYLAGRADAAVLTTLVSSTPELVLKNLGASHAAAAHLRPLDVPCVTLEALLEQQGWPRVDALFVDVEGFENDILLHADLARLDATLIVYEHHLLADSGAAINLRLRRQGYTCTQIEGDTVAVR